MRKPRRRRKVGRYDEQGIARIGLPAATLAAVERAVEKALRTLLVPNDDGRMPVDVKIIDRTKYEPVHYVPLEYVHPYEPKTLDADRVRYRNAKTASCNVQIAAGQLRQAMFELEPPAFEDGKQ